MLEIYLSHRPVADTVNFEQLAERLEGYSGADVKYLCDRAATIPFLRAVATGPSAPEAEIDDQILTDVLAETPRSVSTEMLKRFEEWGKMAVAG